MCEKVYSDTRCLMRNLTLHASRNALSADHGCIFNQPTTSPISSYQKRPEAAIMRFKS